MELALKNRRFLTNRVDLFRDYFIFRYKTKSKNPRKNKMNAGHVDKETFKLCFPSRISRMFVKAWSYVSPDYII